MLNRRRFLTHLPLGFAGAAIACSNSGPEASSTAPAFAQAVGATRSAPLLKSVPAGAATLSWTPKHTDLVYTFGGAAPRQRIKPDAHRDVDRRLLRRRGEDVGRSAVEGDAAGPRQPADRPVLYRGRRAGRHGRRAHSQVEPARNYAVSSFGPGWRARRHDASHGDARPRLSGSEWRYDVDAGATSRAARSRATASTRGTCRCRRSSAASASRRRWGKRAARSCPAPSAATWIAGRCARATPCSSA